MESASDRYPAPVCQRGNDEPTRCPHILVPILQISVDLLDPAIISLFLPVVSQLLLPGKVVYGCHALLDQAFNYVPCMDISGDQSNYDFSLQRSQLASHQLCQLSQLGLIQVKPFLEREGIARHVVDVDLGLGAPHNLGHSCDHRAIVVEHPAFPLHAGIVIEPLFHELPESVPHCTLD